MKNSLFGLFVMLVATTSVFADYELFCDEVNGSKAKFTFNRDLLQFSSKESSIHQKGMKELLKAAGASAASANKYSNIQLSFETDNFQCSELEPFSVDVQCKLKHTVLKIKARQYKHSASNSFDQYKLNLKSLILTAKNTEFEENTLISISIRAGLLSNDKMTEVPFKYHLFLVESGFNASCFLNKIFEIL